MSSDLQYKLWLRNAAGTEWVEMEFLSRFTFQMYQNVVPSFTCDIYVEESDQQDLITTGRLFRITTIESTDGTVQFRSNGSASGEGGTGWEVMTGDLNKPVANKQTAVRNSKPVGYSISGRGLMDRLRKMVYKTETTFPGTTATSIIDSLRTQVNTQAGSTVLVAGTQDTGPTLNMRAREDNLLGLLLDICSAGDSTNKFLYYLQILHDASFVPQINYLSPANALFETTDPFSPRDEGRILDKDIALRSFDVVDERDRIVNATVVRYGGFGTGVEQTDTAVCENADVSSTTTSRSTVGRREAIINSAWLRDNASAVLLRDTVQNMFKGDANGLRRGEAVLLDGQLFTGDFDAVLGDQIGIEDSTGELLQGKFLGCEYDQESQALKVVIGIPDLSGGGGGGASMGALGRSEQAQFSSMEETLFTGTTETIAAPLFSDNVVVDDSSGITNAITSVAAGASSVYNYTISTPNDFNETHEVYLELELVLGGASAVCDGPVRVEIWMWSTTGVGYPVFIDTFVSLFPGESYQNRGVFPFAVDNSAPSTGINRVELKIFNDGSVDTLTLNTGVRIYISASDQHSIDLTHKHNN